MGAYCKKCILKEGNPGVFLHEDGVCNYCKGDLIKSSVMNFKDRLRNCFRFEQDIKRKKENMTVC